MANPDGTRLRKHTKLIYCRCLFSYPLTACPPCYDQIQTLVDRLRTNLRELVKITAQFNSSKPGDVIVDLNFDSRFKQLTEAVNSLLEKAEESNSTDRRLQQQLEILNERVGNITELLAEASSKTNLSEAYVASMLKNIEEAEASINRSRSMLDEAERLLLKEGLVALNESIHAANTSSKQAVRMVEILNKVWTILIPLLLFYVQDFAISCSSGFQISFVKLIPK